MATIIPKEKNWYALYLITRHEKKVSERFTEAGIDHYLPLHKVLKKWSDRKKWVEEPVFKSYIFVFIGIAEYDKVLKTEGVVCFVKFGRKIEKVPESQIEAIQKILGSGEEIEVDNHTYEPGDQVEVIHGPMAGLTGELIEKQGRKKLLLHVDIIGQNLQVSVKASQVRKI